MHQETLLGRPISDVDTPALLLDLGAAERNIARMADFFADKPCKVRPHTKTHKLPMLAHAQIKAGAIGVTCAKVEEAGLFIDHGISSVLIANQIVGITKIRRLLELQERADVIVCIDSLQNAQALSNAAAEVGKHISFLIEIDVGLHRCGVAPLKPAVDFLQQITRFGHLRFRGINGYEGSLFSEDPAETQKLCRESNALFVETRALIERAGFEVEICSAGSSNTYDLSGSYPGITDVQPGAYVTMDACNAHYGVPFEQAVTILATVTSRPAPDRAITDAGKRSLTSDLGLPICTAEGIELRALNDEHGILGIASPENPLQIGEKISFIPTHGCTTIPCFDEYILTRNGIVEGRTPIIARAATR